MMRSRSFHHQWVGILLPQPNDGHWLLLKSIEDTSLFRNGNWFCNIRWLQFIWQHHSACHTKHHLFGFFKSNLGPYHLFIIVISAIIYFCYLCSRWKVISFRFATVKVIIGSPSELWTVRMVKFWSMTHSMIPLIREPWEHVWYAIGIQNG